MALDLSLPLRQAIVTALRADTGLTAITERIYGERVLADPTFPFVRYGVSDTVPQRGACWDGSRINVPIHSFSKADFTDEVAQMNAAVALALDGKVLALDGGKAHLRWTGSRIIPDASEASAWHGIVSFEAVAG